MTSNDNSIIITLLFQGRSAVNTCQHAVTDHVEHALCKIGLSSVSYTAGITKDCRMLHAAFTARLAKHPPRAVCIKRLGSTRSPTNAASVTPACITVEMMPMPVFITVNGSLNTEPTKPLKGPRRACCPTAAGATGARGRGGNAPADAPCPDALLAAWLAPGWLSAVQQQENLGVGAVMQYSVVRCAGPLPRCCRSTGAIYAARDARSHRSTSERQLHSCLRPPRRTQPAGRCCLSQP